MRPEFRQFLFPIGLRAQKSGRPAALRLAIASDEVVELAAIGFELRRPHGKKVFERVARIYGVGNAVERHLRRHAVLGHTMQCGRQPKVMERLIERRESRRFGAFPVDVARPRHHKDVLGHLFRPHRKTDAQEGRDLGEIVDGSGGCQVAGEDDQVRLPISRQPIQVAAVLYERVVLVAPRHPLVVEIGHVVDDNAMAGVRQLRALGHV